MYFIVNPNDFKGITFALSDDGIHVRELLCDEYDAKTLDDIRRDLFRTFDAWKRTRT